MIYYLIGVIALMLLIVGYLLTKVVAELRQVNTVLRHTSVSNTNGVPQMVVMPPLPWDGRVDTLVQLSEADEAFQRKPDGADDADHWSQR